MFTPGNILNAASVWRTLKRSIGLILAFIVLALILAGAAIVVLPQQFTATAILLVDPRQQRVIQSEAVLPGIGNDAAAVESQVEVIESTALARKVITELHLDQDREFVGPSPFDFISSRLADWLPARPPAPDAAMQKIIAKFSDRLKIRRRGLTYVIDVGFMSDDAEKAARIANAVAQAYLTEQVTVKFDATAQASELLNGRLAELQRQVGDAERAVADYKGRNGLVETSDRRTLIDQQLGDLNQQLVQQQVRTGDLRARYDQMKTASASAVAANGLPEALSSQVILALRTQYAQAARSQADLVQTYGPRYPAVQSGEAQLNALRGQITAELGRLSAGLRNQLAAAQAREKALTASLAQLKRDSAVTDQSTVRLRELERNADATRTVLQQFLLRFKETSEQQTLQVPDARIISPASAPLHAGFPSPPIFLSLAGVAGLLLGLGVAFGRESFSHVIRSSQEAEAVLGLPVLGLVPAIKPGDMARLKSAVPRDLDPPGSVPPMSPVFHHAVDQPLSAFGRAIRDIAIRLRTAHVEGSQVMLVTSTIAGEGSSMVAANLANVLAKSGSSTLLIDADFRWPPEKGAPPMEGLFQALRDGDPPQSLLSREPSTGLKLLRAGTIDDMAAASELLTGSAMDIVLGTLRRKFDVVIIDGAPLLDFVDSRYLLELADAALLVTAWDKTDRRNIQAAIHSLGPNAAKLRGIVLNKVDLKVSRARDGEISLGPE